jgi:outer membrane receptor protein involved in Fe transport
VGRLSALWQPDDTLSILPSVFIQRYEQSNTNSFRQELGGLRTSNRFEEPGEDSLDVASLTITKDFESFSFTSLTGYMDREVAFERDYSFFVGSLVPPAFSLDSYNISDSFTTNYTQEFRIASNSADSRWNYVVGVFYSDQEDRLFQIVETGGAGGFFGTGTDIVYVGNTETETQEAAVFGEISYRLTDRLEATIGMRYFSIDQEVNAQYDGVFNGGPSAVEGAEQDETGLNPKFSLAFDVSEENLLYATASKGFRQGGPNRFAFDPDLCRADLDRLGITEAPDSFESDEIWTYELGSKNRLADGRLTLNGSAYYTDWSDIQQTIELTGCGFNFTGNVGSAEVLGGEVEMQLQASDRLSFLGSVAYTDAEITDSAPGVSAQDGQPVLDVPEWMASVSAIYSMPIGAGWQATLRADYQYQGSMYRSFNEIYTTNLPDGTTVDIPDPTRKQDEHDVANAFLLLEKQGLEVRFYMRNIFNETPLLDYSLNQIQNATTLRPRTYGMNIRKYF